MKRLGIVLLLMTCFVLMFAVGALAEEVKSFPNGCTDCHKKVSADKDYSLQAELKKVKGHPEVGTNANINTCLTCHQGPMSLREKLHQVHFESQYFAPEGGNCFACHESKLKGVK